MNLNQPVIAYVEDDENSIVLMEMVVERVMGLQTLHVLKNSARFVEWIKSLEETPDIFLLDIQMEPYNGFELLIMLRNNSRYKTSKVIALTASVMNEEVARLKQNGFDGAIAKPLNLNIFPDLIADIMDGKNVWYIN